MQLMRAAYCRERECTRRGLKFKRFRPETSTDTEDKERTISFNADNCDVIAQS